MSPCILLNGIKKLSTNYKEMRRSVTNILKAYTRFYQNLTCLSHPSRIMEGSDLIEITTMFSHREVTYAWKNMEFPKYVSKENL